MTLFNTTLILGRASYLIKDTISSLWSSLAGEHLVSYHVRAIFTDGDQGIDSAAVSSPDDHLEISKSYGATSGIAMKGYAVYGNAPEGYFVCGDELNYQVADFIARMLNGYRNSHTSIQKCFHSISLLRDTFGSIRATLALGKMNDYHVRVVRSPYPFSALKLGGGRTHSCGSWSTRVYGPCLDCGEEGYEDPDLMLTVRGSAVYGFCDGNQSNMRSAAYGFSDEEQSDLQFVCGDELPYAVAFLIAWLLNGFYRDSAIIPPNCNRLS